MRHASVVNRWNADQPARRLASAPRRDAGSPDGSCEGSLQHAQRSVSVEAAESWAAAAATIAAAIDDDRFDCTGPRRVSEIVGNTEFVR